MSDAPGAVYLNGTAAAAILQAVKLKTRQTKFPRHFR